MNKTIQIVTIFILLSCIPCNAQDLNKQQTSRLISEVNRVLQVLEKYSSYIPGSDSLKEVPSEYRMIFETDSRILNYLDPYAKEQIQISPDEYFRFIRINYAFGLSFQMRWNAGKIGKPIAADAQKKKYMVSVPVTVMAIGLFNEQKIHNLSQECYAIIGFRLEKESVSDVVIRYVQAEKPSYKYTQASDFSVGIYAAPAFTRIHSTDIFTDEVWDAWGEFGYRAGLKLMLKLNQTFTLYTGAGLSNFRSVYEILDFNNENVNNIKKLDKDNDEYFLYVNTSVTESNTLTYLDIPLGIKYNMGSSKLRFTVQAGFDFSFLLSSRYSATGSSDHRGYYPQYHVVLDNLPDYGFTNEKIDINDDWDLNTFNLSANILLGVDIQLTDKILLTIGPYANTGLTDLGYKTSKHRDDYLNISGNPGKMTTQSAGLLFEIIYKL